MNATIEAASGNKDIAFYEELSDRSAMTFMFDTTGPTPALFIWFQALDHNLQHGDRYSIAVTSPDGRELYKFDQTIDYDSPQMNERCSLRCKVKTFDSRATLPDSADIDAGTP